MKRIPWIEAFVISVPIAGLLASVFAGGWTQVPGWTLLILVGLGGFPWNLVFAGLVVIFLPQAKTYDVSLQSLLERNAGELLLWGIYVSMVIGLHINATLLCSLLLGPRRPKADLN